MHSINGLLLQHTEMSSSEKYWSYMLISVDGEKGHLLGSQKQAEMLRENLKK